MSKGKTLNSILVSILIFLFFAAVITAAFLGPYFLPAVKYKKYVKQYSVLNGLEPSLVFAVIKAESGGCRKKISDKGACGVMQLMPYTAEWVCGNENLRYEKEMLFDAEFNIRVGCAYLAYLKDKFLSEETAVAAYNAGEGNVSGWLKVEDYSSDGVSLKKIPFSETEEYVKRINKNKKVYRMFLKNDYSR